MKPRDDDVPQGNLLEYEPARAAELFESLLRTDRVHIERIVSHPPLEPTDYLQSHDEWIMVAQGAATLVMAGQTHQLKAGDWLLIPGGTAHTLVDVSETTVWLAIHLHDGVSLP